MRTQFVLAVLCAGGLVFVGLDHLPGGNAEPGAGGGELLERVEQLEATVAGLEEELAKERSERRRLEQRLEGISKGRKTYVVPSPQVVPVPQAESGVPRHWKRGEINGIPYYIIPLEDAGDGR